MSVVRARLSSSTCGWMLGRLSGSLTLRSLLLLSLLLLLPPVVPTDWASPRVQCSTRASGTATYDHVTRSHRKPVVLVKSLEFFHEEGATLQQYQPPTLLARPAPGLIFLVEPFQVCQSESPPHSGAQEYGFGQPFDIETIKVVPQQY